MHTVSLPRPPAEGKPPEPRVTVALGAALIVQSGVALIWTGAASERLAQLERRADANAAIIERTARLEEQARHMTDTLERIEAKIDQQNREKS